MFCANCGTKRSDDVGACRACGAQAPASAPRASAGARAPNAAPGQPAPAPQDSDLVAMLGERLRREGALAVDQRMRQAMRGIGEDARATLEAVVTSPEGQQLTDRVAEIDAATGGTMSRAVRVLGALLTRRTRRNPNP